MTRNSLITLMNAGWERKLRRLAERLVGKMKEWKKVIEEMVDIESGLDNDVMLSGDKEG